LLFRNSQERNASTEGHGRRSCRRQRWNHCHLEIMAYDYAIMWRFLGSSDVLLRHRFAPSEQHLLRPRTRTSIVMEKKLESSTERLDVFVIITAPCSLQALAACFTKSYPARCECRLLRHGVIPTRRNSDTLRAKLTLTFQIERISPGSSAIYACPLALRWRPPTPQP
jgi:hypothetical protein